MNHTYYSNLGIIPVDKDSGDLCTGTGKAGLKLTCPAPANVKQTLQGKFAIPAIGIIFL